MRALAALAFAVLCAVTPGVASAQGRDNAYTVAGVQTDATAANATQAQAQAMAQAQQAGFDRLVRRLTQPADVQRLGVPQVAGPQLDSLVSSVDVNDERRSGTRYIGRVTVRFSPDNVRALLRQSGFSIVETRTAPVLIVAQAPGAPDATAAMWQDVWLKGGFNEELVPLAIAPNPIDGAPDWTAAGPVAGNSAAATALYVTMRVSGAQAAASLIEVGPNGVRRDRGLVTARIQGGDAGLRPALEALARQASDVLQNEWKARAVTTGGARARVSASALYGTESEWQTIKNALQASAATLISEIRIEAVGRTGALVSFSFVGDQSALVTELRRHGVSLENAEIGPVLRVARQ